MIEINEPESINLLKPHTEHIASKEQEIEIVPVKRRFSSSLFRLAFFGGALVLVGAFLFSAGIARTAPQEGSDSFSIFASLSRLVRSGEKAIAGEADDRINVLLLGIGGAGHDGPELTDTIIFASFKPSTKELGLISIPRDLAVKIPGYGYRKINAVNALAEQQKDGQGLSATSDTVSDIMSESIPYAIKIDFDGFAEIIDAIGGVDIYVERDFTDTTFPLDDGLGSVQTVSFVTGWTHMDGKTALHYARSRHGNNNEGGDFARAARQQKILLAAKDKMLSLGFILNPAKLTRILSIIQSNVSTNMNALEMLKLAKYAPDVSADKITMHVLDTGPAGILYNIHTEGLGYGILPYKEDWSDLKAMAKNIFEVDATTKISLAPPATAATIESVTLEIQNGTAETGLAGQTAQLLESSGFDIINVTNATDRTAKKTIIYDFTEGAKDDELAALKKYLHAAVYVTKAGYLNSSAFVPDNVVDKATFENLKISSEKIDFLVILGQDSTNLVLR